MNGYGRYVLEKDEHIDVIVARKLTMPTGESLLFDEVWKRRENMRVAGGAFIGLPAIEDLISTKKIAARPKDLEDIRLLKVLRDAKKSKP